MKNSTTPTVSVVIPAFNEEKYIGRCIDALLEQSILPNEIIVVDNNSTDKTAQIANSYKEVTLIKESQQGIVFARNAGFNKATSEIIGRIDADTEVDENWIETVIESMQDDKVLGVSGSVRISNTRFPRTYGIFWDIFGMYGTKVLLGTYLLWGNNCAFRQSAYLEVKDKLNPDYVWEDTDLTWQIAKIGYIKFNKQMKVQIVFRHADDSIRAILGYIFLWPKALWPYRKLSAVIAWLVLTINVPIWFIPFVITHLIMKKLNPQSE